MRWTRYVHAIERDWLGVAQPHPRHVIDGTFESRLSQWAPDRPGIEYCARCGSSVGPGEYRPDRGCGSCASRRFPWTHVVRLGAYQGDLREWIHACKFERWDSMGEELGRRLGRAVEASGVEIDAIVPVPTAITRRWRRGVDHTAALARGVSSALVLPVEAPLWRVPHPTQRAVAPSQRRANVRRTFRLKPWGRAGVAGRTVLLVDDVATTHSTLIEAARALRLLARVHDIVVGVVAVADAKRRDPS